MPRLFAAGFLIFAVALLAALGNIAQAQANGPFPSVEPYQLLTPEVGWRVDRGTLYWTTDRGLHWKDITPHDPREIPPVRSLNLSAFFLNSTTGWVFFFGRPERHAPKAAQAPTPKPYWSEIAEDYDLAATTDGGKTWSLTRLVLPTRYPAVFAFADPAHGWMQLPIEVPYGSVTDYRGAVGPQEIRITGELLVTSDGGRTWKPAPNCPAVYRGIFASLRGRLLAVTPQEAWLLTAVDHGHLDRRDYEGLYVTYDGARSWRRVSLKAPPGIQAGQPNYDLPIFTSSKHGFEAVTYCDVRNQAAVLFETDDGGNAWRPDRTLTIRPDVNLPEYEDENPCSVASTVVGDAWIVAASVPGGKPALKVLGPGQRATVGGPVTTTDFEPEFSEVPRSPLRLSFVSPTHGWMWHQGLRSTSDGGKTWTLIDPDPAYGAGESLPAIAQALDSAAAEKKPDLHAFGYKVAFDPPLQPRAKHLPTGLSVEGFFQTPTNDREYWPAYWREHDTRCSMDFRPYGDAFRPQPCRRGASRQLQPQPLADHLPLRGWSIDFPQILRAVRRNAALFPYGAISVYVTTARRLKVEDQQPKGGCWSVVYNGDAKRQRLSGIDDARPIAEIEGTPSGTAHYLILDARTGAAIERGTYKRSLLRQ